MNTETLTRALRELKPETLDWRLAFYNTYKGRDGLELEWHLCEMKGIATQVDTVRENLLKKPVAEKPVAQYTPFLCDKENIGAMGQEDEIIREQLSDILTDIRHGQLQAPEDFTTGVIKKPTGYAFYGVEKDDAGKLKQQILLMRRGNPFLTGQAAKLLIAAGSELAVSNKPIVKFTPAADLLLIGEVCYLLSSSVEKDLSLESRHFAIAQKRMAAIAEAGIVSDYDRLEACAMKSKNARKFLDFDADILAHITRLSIIQREEFLSTYGVTIDHEGHMDTYEPEQCELIVDLLCGRSCLDPLGRLSVVSNLTARE